MDGLDGFSEPAAKAPQVSALDAERGVIASVLCDDGRKHRAAERSTALVAPSDFANERHVEIWTAIVDVLARGDAPDTAAVADALTNAGHHLAVPALGTLAGVSVDPSTCEQHARRVAEHAYCRTHHVALRTALKRIEGYDDPLTRVAEARAIMAAAPTSPKCSKDDHIREAIVRVFERMEARAAAAARGERATALWGVDTLDGFVDEEGRVEVGALGGLFPGKLYVIAGVPGSGKTSCAWAAVLATARAGKRVIVFSLEMTAEDICQRLAGQACGIDESKIENGTITADELTALGTFLMNDLAQLPIYVPTDCRTLDQMRSRILADVAIAAAEGDPSKGVALVVIDFLQRAKASHRTTDGNRDDEERVYEAKGIANDANVPVLAVSSMTKVAQNLATNEGKVDVTGTKGAGTEYAADVVVFLVREKDGDTYRPKVTFNIVKRRGGPLSAPVLIFDLARGTFSSDGPVCREGARPESIHDRDMPEDDGYIE